MQRVIASTMTSPTSSKVCTSLAGAGISRLVEFLPGQATSGVQPVRSTQILPINRFPSNLDNFAGNHFPHYSPFPLAKETC